jgi:hypothetical protein
MLPGMSTLNGAPGPGAVLTLTSTVSAGPVSTTTLAGWVVVAVLVGIALGLLGTWLAGRRRHTRSAPTAVPPAGAAHGIPGPAFVDDLPGFLEHPPGAPAPAEAATSPAGATASGPSTGGGRSARSSILAMVVAALVLVLLAVVVAVTAGRDPTGTASTVSVTAVPTTAAPTAAAPMGVTAGEPAAASLAFRSVPLGADGAAASVTFGGVLLEQRAVGLTVTYPSLSVSSDGAQALAHVRLPTFNCLTGEPPADPVAAGCSRSLTEYADLASPDLRVSRDGDRLDVVGLFPTYTRSNGAPPAYTGRAYQLTVTVAPDGPVRDGAAAAGGVVRIGLDSAASTPVPGVNVVQFAG